MTFEQVLPSLRQGKKIKDPDGNTLVLRNGIVFLSFRGVLYTQSTTTFSYILREGWEVIEGDL